MRMIDQKTNNQISHTVKNSGKQHEHSDHSDIQPQYIRVGFRKTNVFLLDQKRESITAKVIPEPARLHFYFLSGCGRSLPYDILKTAKI